jgi:heterotetrameric sarcosine oxidase gamma subunit
VDDLDFAPRPPLAPLAGSGVRLEERTGIAVVQVIARRGRSGDLAQAAAALFGEALPAEPSAVFAADATLVWSGPGQFLMVHAAGGAEAARARFEAVRSALGTAASVFDQSDSRRMLVLDGARVREVLARLVSVDTDPAAFPVGRAAAASVEHLSVNLWRMPDSAGSPVFGLLVSASYASSIRHAIAEAMEGLAPD